MRCLSLLFFRTVCYCFSIRKHTRILSLSPNPNSMFCLLEQKIIAYPANMNVEWKLLLLSQNGHVGRSQNHYCKTFRNSIEVLLKDNVKIKKVLKQYFPDTKSKVICNLLVLNIMFKMLQNDTNYTSMFDKLTSYNKTNGKYCIVRLWWLSLMVLMFTYKIAFLSTWTKLPNSLMLVLLINWIDIFINNRFNTFPFRLCFAKRRRRWGYPVLGSSKRRQAGHILDSRQVGSVLLY